MPDSFFMFIVELMVFMFYWGGLLPAYRAARANGCNVFSSIFNAICWPMDVSYVLAREYCAEHKT